MPLAGALILGTVCFASLGLAISSVITSAESAGPVAYASFLPIAGIISGVFDPTFSGLPGWLDRLVSAFPVKALAEVLQNTYAVPAVYLLGPGQPGPVDRRGHSAAPCGGSAGRPRARGPPATLLALDLALDLAAGIAGRCRGP